MKQQLRWACLLPQGRHWEGAHCERGSQMRWLWLPGGARRWAFRSGSHCPCWWNNAAWEWAKVTVWQRT